jgi:hypothetical protein
MHVALGFYPITKPPRRRNMSVGTREDRNESDFSNTLSAGRQQRIKTRLKERNDNYYAQQSQNTKGLNWTASTGK